MEWFKERLILFVVGFGLVFSLFLVKLIQNPYEDKGGNSTRSQTHLTVEKPMPKPVPTIGSTTHTPQTNPKPERDEWRAERDLEAQSDMAKWAKKMFFSSLVMAFLSAVGIWLIYATLRATRHGTTAMQEAFKETKFAVKTELKAYLALKKAVIKIIDPTGSPCFAVELSIQNVGNTPAFNIVTHCIPFTSDNRTFKTPFQPEVETPDKTVSGYLPQNMEAIAGVFIVQGVQFDTISDGGGGFEQTNNADTFIVAEGIVEFDDIYTVNDSKLPKRTITFHRYIGSHVPSASKAMPMKTLAWKEKAT